MKTLIINSVLVSAAATLVLAPACSKSSDALSGSVNLPLITPIVKAAAPSAYKGANASMLEAFDEGHARSLGASDVQTRFFETGPTVIYNILGLIDQLISAQPGGVNGATGACLTQTPVAYTINPFGETVTMYSQCARTQTAQFSGDSAFFQFGINNNLIYLYSASGVGRVAAIVTPLDANGNPVAVPVITGPGATPSSSPSTSVVPIANTYSVELWYGIGYGSPPATGSYGVVHIVANSVTKAFEMTAAGQGFGYCGIQIKSDGTAIYTTGSTDMGTTCNTADTLCVKASDGSTAATCGSSLTTFSLPPLGRVTSTGPNGSTLGASGYPGGGSNSITLTGANTDSLWFGPTVVTPGTGSL